MSIETPFRTTSGRVTGLTSAALTTTASSTSPAALSFTLPSQGIWIGHLTASFSNNVRLGSVGLLLKWYSPDSTNWLLGVDLIGTATLLGTVTALTVAAPNSSGVFVATVTSSTTGTQSAKGVCNLRRIAANGDIYPNL